MNIKPRVTFVAAPNTVADDILVEIMTGWLRNAGETVSTPKPQSGGWLFTVRTGARAVRLRHWREGERHVLDSTMPSLLRLLRSHEAYYARVLTLLDSRLRRDKRFTDVRWRFLWEPLNGEVDGALLRGRQRTVANFKSKLPDDSLFEEDGDVSRYPGKNMAELVVGWCGDAGMTTSEPEHQFELGWDFTVRSGSEETWVQVSVIDEEVYLNTARTGLLGSEEVDPLVLQTIHEGLSGDRRFSRVRWFYLNEDLANARGARSPLSKAKTPKGPVC